MNDITKCKAIAYDLIASIQAAQNQLNQVNTRIAELTKEENEKPKEEVKK